MLRAAVTNEGAAALDPAQMILSAICRSPAPFACRAVDTSCLAMPAQASAACHACAAILGADKDVKEAHMMLAGRVLMPPCLLGARS